MSSLDAYMILSGLCDMGYLSLAILLMCLYEVCLIYLKKIVIFISPTEAMKKKKNATHLETHYLL